MTASPSETTIEAIRGVLAHHDEVLYAIVFGSVAMGRADPDSDADIAVAAARPLTAGQKMALMGDLASATGRPIDLIDLNRVGEPVLGQVLRHGKRIVGTDEHHAALITRHLLDEADFMPYYRRILAERRRTWIGS